MECIETKKVSLELSFNSAHFCQINSINSAWQYMELVIVWDTGSTENSVAYLGEHQTYTLRASVQLPSKLWLVVKSFGYFN